ncbi:MAG: zf-HC2 domain-containing protein [Gemmatimonadota bacterium]
MRKFDRLTCEATFRRLDDYLDRELTPEEMVRVREHLETCEGCAQEFAFEASILRAVRNRLPRLAAPPELLARISRALRADPGEGGDG